MSEQSTKILNNRPADYGRFFANAAIAAVTALDTISKLPPFGPGRTEIKCLTLTGTPSVTVTMEDGQDLTNTFTAVGEVWVIPITVKAFKAVSGTGTFEAKAYWWWKPQLEEHQYKPNLNP